MERNPLKSVGCRVICLLLIGLTGWAQTPPDSAQRRRSILFFPVLARSIETGWAGGVASTATFRFNRQDTVTRTSNVQALAIYTARRQFVTALNSTIFFPGERYILNTQMSYSHFPDKFWGLGNVAPDSNEEPYTFRQYYIYMHLQRLLGRRLFAGLVYEFQRLMDVTFVPGGLIDQKQVPGRFPYHISGAGLSLTYDSRNNAFTPSAGTLAQVYFEHCAPYVGSQFTYTNYVVDLRTFRRITGRHILAMQAFGFFGAGEVPLRSFATFGGSNNMRGYYDGRYRDKTQVVLQAEYRLPLFWRIGAVGFGSIGNVAGQPGTSLVEHVKWAYGAGLRFALKPSEGLNLRIDYGIGQGTSRGLYFQIGEAF